MAWKGKFKPANPKKYKGNQAKIIYRSSLEFKMMRKFDSSPHVIWWSSEEVIVHYFDPVTQRMRRYFPDFVVRKIGPKGIEETVMIEVKPFKETNRPRHTPRKRRSRIIAEELTWATNQAKWAAAEAFCAKQGWTFQTITEREIGLSY